MTEDNNNIPVPIASGLAFSGLCNLRNTEGHLRWMGAQFGMLLNIPGWVTVAMRILASPTLREIGLLMTGSILFAAANYLLFEMQARDTKLMNYWNRTICQLEEINGVQGNIQIFSSKEFKRLSRSKARIGKRLLAISVCSIIVWVVLAIVLLVLIATKWST